jgi:hypothetical protein
MEQRKIPYIRTEQHGNYLLPNQMTNKTPVIKSKNGQNSCNQIKELSSNPVIKLKWLALFLPSSHTTGSKFLPTTKWDASISAIKSNDFLNFCHEAK